MTGPEFDTGMNLIYSRWGQKNYPEQLRARIWYHCNILPYKSFEKIVLTLMDTSRAAPMPNEFRILAHAERDRLGLRGVGEAETKHSSQADCWDCGDSGNLAIETHQGHMRGTLRCHCQAGRARPNAQGAIWSQSFEAKWRKLPQYEKGKGDWRPRDGQDAIDMLNALITKPVEKSRRKGQLTRAGDILSSKRPGGEGA